MLSLAGCAVADPFDPNSKPIPFAARQNQLPRAETVPNTRPAAAGSVEVRPANHQEAKGDKAQQGTMPAQIPPPRPLPPGEPGGAGPAREPAPTELTLDQVINAVLVSDPKLRAGFEAINQASADALTASLRPNPTLFHDIQLLPLTRPFTPTRQGGPPQEDVQITYPIDWYLFGKRAANMVAAAHGVRVSESEFADRVRQRVSEAAVAFYDVVEAKALLALARQDVANLERIEVALAKAVAAGGKTQLDLNQFRLDLAQARRLAREAETTLVTARARLRAMIGRSDADPAFDVAGSLDLPLAASLPEPEEGFALAVQNRPDLQALRWKGAQARANVEVETRKAYPDVAPMFGYTHQYQRQAIGFPDADSWTAAVTMSLPLFNRNQGNRLRAASAVAQNQFEYQAALAGLRAEVETASRECRAARATADEIAGDQLRIARDVLEGIATAYQLGGRPLVEFLNAERTLRETYRAYATSRAAYWRAVYRYRAAIGQQSGR
jgi:cobalt-zinc-cadmium efflux system outer membrane protein